MNIEGLKSNIDDLPAERQVKHRIYGLGVGVGS